MSKKSQLTIVCTLACAAFSLFASACEQELIDENVDPAAAELELELADDDAEEGEPAIALEEQQEAAAQDFQASAQDLLGADPALDLSENGDSVRVEGTDNIGGCPGAYPECDTCSATSCGQYCCVYEEIDIPNQAAVAENGVEAVEENVRGIWHRANCDSHISPVWQPDPDAGRQLCHIDPDRHLLGVKVELYGATQYRDTSCLDSPARWRKSKLTSISCSWFTSLTDGSECARRVENAIGNYAGQGWTPTFQRVDRDYCPKPRI